MARKNRRFAKLATDIDAGGNLQASGIQSEALDVGVTVYATRASLPSSGNTAGDQAYVTENNRLYIWKGSGWYNVALLNFAPAISSVQDTDGGTTPFALSSEGAVTRITITAADSDGEPITYSATADSDFAGLATLSQDSSVFTITPFSQDSASTRSGDITFTATDGVNIASSGVQTFTLNFISALWDETVLSIGTSSTNSLGNKTYIDRSTNSADHTVGLTGTASRDNHYQTAFHPYLDNWSVEFDGSGDYLSTSDTVISDYSSGVYTVEAWVMFNSTGRSGIVQKSDTYELYLNGSGNIQWGVRSNTASPVWMNVTHTESIEAGVWYHILAIKASSSINVAVNGVFATASSIANGAPGGSYNTLIGVEDEYPFGSPNNYLNGYLSDVRISNSVLYSVNFSVPDSTLSSSASTQLLTCQSNRFIDNSTNAHTITANGNVAVSAYNPFGQESEYDVGENKGSLYRPTATSWKINNLSSSLDLSGDFTIEMWWYPDNDGSTSQQYIMDFGSSPRLSVWWYWNGSNQDYSFYAYTNGFRKFSTASNQIYPNRQWNHLAFVRTISDGTVRLYANGVFQGATEVNFAGDPTGDQFNVGNPYGGNSESDSYWSDVKITPSAKYSSNFTPPTTPLGSANAGLYYPFDNAGIFDKTGNYTLTGTATTTTGNVAVASSSINFNNNPLKLTGGVSTLSGDFTIEFWAECNVTGQACILFDNHQTAYNGNFSMRSDYVSGTNSTMYGSVGGHNFNFQYPVADFLNTTAHWAITREGSSVKIFLNGVQKNTTGTATGTSDLSNGFYIGGAAGPTSGYSNLTGIMEGFQILHGVAKYTASFTPPTQTQGRTYQATS